MTDIANILMNYKTNEQRTRQQRPQTRRDYTQKPVKKQKVVVIPDMNNNEMFPVLEQSTLKQNTVWQGNVLANSLKNGKEMVNDSVKVYQTDDIIVKKGKIILVEDRRVIYEDLLDNDKLSGHQIRNYF